MSLLQHPGSLPYSPETQAAISSALAALPAEHAPRTRHWGGRDQGEAQGPDAPAGSEPNYTNRLICSASPYLRQHAHNPVDWRPWGPEALEEARAAGRPVFLSIGYATCHWCHVMERESFEDLGIAEVLNRLYIPVKVDREERPDVDAVYMAAVQAMTGQGGWPMSVWLLPEAEAGSTRALPFFAGTYFPPHGGQRGSRYGFAELVEQLAEVFQRDPQRVQQQGLQLAHAVRSHLDADLGGGAVGTEATDSVARDVAAGFDGASGGRRIAPKFPSHVPIRLLLRHALRTGSPESLNMAHFTLSRMAAGGIYDHVGGGFHRYSTDARWFAPHFEKMLYDQALITLAALDLLQATGDAHVARTVRETLDYLLRDMQDAEGAFYSATDADSEGHEGLYFLWTTEQLREVLGSEEAGLVARVLGATERGNFEGSNILHRVLGDGERPDADPVRDERLRRALDLLRLHRAQRVAPLRDDKILTAWNGMAVSALARAGWLLQEPRYVEAASGAADRILTRHRRGRRLLRASCDGVRSGDGFLEDHAFLIAGLLDLHEATGAMRWLQAAVDLQAVQDDLFSDERGGYFAVAADAQTLIARARPAEDGAEPCGNSVSALNLVRLGALTGQERHTDRACALLEAFSGRLRDAPSALPEMLLAVEALAWPLAEVVLVWPAGSSVETLEPLEQVLRSVWQPHRVVLRAQEGEGVAALAQLAPQVAHKVALRGQATAYVCRHGSCQSPTTEPAELARQLSARPASVWPGVKLGRAGHGA